MSIDTDLAAFWRARKEDYVSGLGRLVDHRSISPKGEDKEENARNQNEIRAALESFSSFAQALGAHAEVTDVDGTPYTMATWDGSGDGHIVIYTHADVQPVKKEKWTTDPFKLSDRQGVLYGRGSNDDKGPGLAAMFAVNFLRNTDYKFPNVTLIVEAEEEVGSPNFHKIIEENKGHLGTADAVVVCDTTQKGGQPTITYSVRGIVMGTFSLETAESTVHSGTIGHLAENPFNIMAGVLARCADGKRNILIPGIYDGITELSEVENAELMRIAGYTDVRAIAEGLGIKRPTTKDAEYFLRGLCSMPSFEIHGMDGSIKGTSVPAECVADVSLRLAHGQDPDKVAKIVRDYIKEANPNVVVDFEVRMAAYKADLDDPLVKMAAEVTGQVYEGDTVFAGEGGSIGAVSRFGEYFPKIPVIMFGVGKPENNMHGNNENFSLEQARQTMAAVAYFANRVASRG